MTETYKTDEQIISEAIMDELAQREVPMIFPEYVIEDRNEYGHEQIDISGRQDLRALDCFTIDGPNARELDDALSLIVTDDGYRLGVHIADVSAFVPEGSALELEAENRGTTIYLPGQTVPMFPSVISEELCSLTPNIDKLAVTMFIDFDSAGNILDYEVCRSVIRSRVRGIYSEVNTIIEGNADVNVLEKYKTVLEEIRIMQTLAEILHSNRAHCGASVSSFNECKYTFTDGMLELSVCGNTEADRMICEFMVAANTCMAYYFEANKLPGIYRVQKETSLNARYSVEQHNHESLAICGGYMRFTSPIRRAADYMVHKVLTSFLEGEPADDLRKRYKEELAAYCSRAQFLEERVKHIERKIVNECHMLYFARHAEETFRGVVVGTSRVTNDTMIALQPYNIRIF
ncbi:MAG: RNB domain-containing ribonuclease, partial [Parasporobacterium sp.]|nr:RNB domain-containing ribonuclease [Parasporobacterium sp.]